MRAINRLTETSLLSCRAPGAALLGQPCQPIDPTCPSSSASILVLVLLGLLVAGGYLTAAEESKPEPAKAVPLPVADLHRDTPVDFEREILPFLKNNCLACHNTTKAKGGLNLETPQLIRKGGDTGPAAKPGQPTESLMFKAAAHLDPELMMPPKDNKANASELKPEQLALLKLWIEQGAQGEVRAVKTVEWLKDPPALDPILSVALTRDGQFAACGRGNRIDVYHVPSGQRVAQLADPKLHQSPGAPPIAHRDLVNSLAFNPDGTLLASAAYREVKLWRRPRLVSHPLTLTNNAIRSFTISPDRHRLATVGPDHRIDLYDLATGSLTHSLTGHSNAIHALAFSPDGKYLASCSGDKTARIWDAEAATPLAIIDHSTELRALAWLGESKALATAGDDGVVRIWNVATNPAALRKELKGHEGKVNALASLAEGKQLLSGGADGVIRHWDIESGKSTREHKQKDAVLALAVRPDGQRFASSGSAKVARLWNPEDGKAIAELKGDRYAYEQVAETERNLTVAKSNHDFLKKSLETAETEAKKQADRVGTATTTNTLTEKVFLEKEKGFKEAQEAKAKAEKDLAELLALIHKTTEEFEHADQAAKEAAGRAKTAAEKAALAQSAAERTVLSKSDAERIAADTSAVALRTKAAVENAGAAKDTAKRIADESAAVAEKSRAFSEAIAADADMKHKLAGDAKAAAEKAIEEVASLSFAAGRLKPAYDKIRAEAPDQRKQATNKIEAAAKTLGNAEKEFKRAETRKSVAGHELELALHAAERSSNGVAQARASLEAAETQQRHIAEILEHQKHAAETNEMAIRALAFSPDGQVLGTLDENGRAHTWTADHGAAIEVFPPPAGEKANPSDETDSLGHEAIAFLDGHTLLNCTGAGTLVGWELQPAWTLERSLGSGDADSPLSDRVNAVRFSPDGRTLATGGGEPTRSGEIKLWRVDDGSFQREYTNVHSDAVLALDFSPDGRHLASAAADRFVRVIELATGKVARSFEGHTSYVLGVAWKGDGRTLASAGADSVIKIWDFITGDRKKNIEGASKEITSVSFIGITDQTLATSGDNQVRILKENGDKVRSLEGAADFMNSAAATPDGKLVIAGGQDGVLRIWKGDDGKVVTNFVASR